MNGWKIHCPSPYLHITHPFKMDIKSLYDVSGKVIQNVLFYQFSPTLRLNQVVLVTGGGRGVGEMVRRLIHTMFNVLIGWWFIN